MIENGLTAWEWVQVVLLVLAAVAVGAMVIDEFWRIWRD